MPVKYLLVKYFERLSWFVLILWVAPVWAVEKTHSVQEPVAFSADQLSDDLEVAPFSELIPDRLTAEANPVPMQSITELSHPDTTDNTAAHQPERVQISEDEHQSPAPTDLPISEIEISEPEAFLPETSPDAMAQITSVTQLSDVQPTDWAYQALQSLVERYGCIAGYPDGTYRGERALTRFEFAAGMNACLDRINELLAASTADLATKDDLATV